VENLPKDSIPAAKPRTEPEIVGNITNSNAPAKIQNQS
jgi:hypothetical protein